MPRRQCSSTGAPRSKNGLAKFIAAGMASLIISKPIEPDAATTWCAQPRSGSCPNLSTPGTWRKLSGQRLKMPANPAARGLAATSSCTSWISPTYSQSATFAGYGTGIAAFAALISPSVLCRHELRQGVNEASKAAAMARKES